MERMHVSGERTQPTCGRAGAHCDPPLRAVVRQLYRHEVRLMPQGKSGSDSTALNQNLAAVAVGAGTSRTIFLHGPTPRAGASFTHRGPTRFDIFEKDGLGKIKALRIFYPRRCLQISELLEFLDAFRDHRHSQGIAKRFNRLEDTLAARTLVDIDDERPVNLDFISGDIGESRQGRISDPEIIDGNSDT